MRLNISELVNSLRNKKKKKTIIKKINNCTSAAKVSQKHGYHPSSMADMASRDDTRLIRKLACINRYGNKSKCADVVVLNSIF